MGSNWYLAQGYQGCPNCLWTRQDDFEGYKGVQQTIGVCSGLIRVDWEMDWGAMGMMISSKVPEVTRNSQHFQKGVTGCKKNPSN